MLERGKKGKWDSSDEESEGELRSSKRAKTTTKQLHVVTSQSQANLSSIESSLLVDHSIVGPESRALCLDSSERGSAAEQASFPITDANIDPIKEDTACAPITVEVPRSHNPIFDGCRSVDCYQRLNFIDQGTYGMVFKARCRETGEVYALKQIKFGPETNKVGFPITALREINILLALQHPNIVRVREMVVGSSIDKIFMVMEYCENDLKTCMQLAKQSFSTAEVRISNSENYTCVFVYRWSV